MPRGRSLRPRGGSRGASWKLDGQTSFRLPLTGEHRRKSLERGGHVAIRKERGDIRHERGVVRAPHRAQHAAAGERFLHALRLLWLEPRVRGADHERTGARREAAVAGEHDPVSEVPPQRGLERRRRRRQLLYRRSLGGLEIEDPQGAVEPGTRRTDLRDRGLSDLAREVPPWLVVEVRVGRDPAKTLAEPGRATQRLACALRPHAVGDPLRGGELSLDTARHHHRVNAGLEPGDDATPAPSDPRTQAAVNCATRSASSPNERVPITGLRGSTFTSQTGAWFTVIPSASRPSATARAARSALRGSPVAPMAMALGKTARYPTRTTDPPSWSTATGTGGRSPRAAVSCASRTIARTWSFERMFPRKAKRTRPPIFPARIASRVGPGTCSPSKPAQTSAPVPSSVTTSAAGDTARA